MPLSAAILSAGTGPINADSTLLGQYPEVTEQDHGWPVRHLLWNTGQRRALLGSLVESAHRSAPLH